MSEINQSPEPTSEDKAYAEIAKFIQGILSNKDTTQVSDEDNSNCCPPCCCPKFIKFKTIGCTVIIINDNAACQRNFSSGFQREDTEN